MKRVCLALGAVLLLAGCAPSTDAALNRCVENVLAIGVENGLDAASLDQLRVNALEQCNASLVEDRESFLELWG